MNNILQIGTLYMAFLGCGSYMILPFFPHQQTGISFTRYAYLQSLVFLALFLAGVIRLQDASTSPQNFLVAGIFCTLVAFHGFVMLSTSLASYLRYLGGLIALGTLIAFARRSLFLHVPFDVMTLNLGLMIIASLFISLSLMAMVFGHWYLVNRELDHSYLIRVCRSLLMLTYARVLSVGAALWHIYSTMSMERFTALTSLSSWYGIMLMARLATGLLVPLVVAHLAYESAKIKSNQSATGILYAGVALALMGECLALYLFSFTGVLL